MGAKPVQVSIDSELLSRIDEDPETRQRGRSAFIRAAVKLYLDTKERRRTDAAIERAYAGEADVLMDEVAELLPDQAWPSD
jgi:metal-responsive CopG/Arc/MetJ family transcriptional regulator